MQPDVLIIAESDDIHSVLVAKALREEFECEPIVFSMSGFPAVETASFECGMSRTIGNQASAVTATIGDLNLASVRAIWWRRPERCSAPNDYFVFDKDFIQVECEQFLQGLLWSTSCVWVNHPTHEILATRKIHQLAEAARVGLCVPRTIVTNSRGRAEAFIATFGKALVTKRIGTTPGLATRTILLTEEECKRLPAIETCPTTLQEYIEPQGDVRVIVIGTDQFAFWIDSCASACPVDSRMDLGVEHSAFELPERERALIRTLLDRLGLVFGVVDLRVSPSGQFYFLEVNPSGQYVYLEILTGVPLSRHVARLLADCARSASPWRAVGTRPEDSLRRKVSNCT